MKKRMERPKLAILNHFRPLWWENIGKSAEQSKLSVLNDFMYHFGRKRLEKV